MITKEEFAKKYNLDIKYLNGEPYVGNLNITTALAIPDNCIFNVEGRLAMDSLESIPANTVFNIDGELDLPSVIEMGNNVTFNVENYLVLPSLNTIPHNTIINVGEWVDMTSVRSVESAVVFTVGGGLKLQNVTHISPGTVFNVGSYLDLESLHTIPANVVFNVGNWLDLTKVTYITPGTVLTVGKRVGLTSMRILCDNITINCGGFLFLDNVRFVAKTVVLNGGEVVRLAKTVQIEEGAQLNFLEPFSINGTVCPAAPNGHIITAQGYIIADGILTKLIKQKGNVYHVQALYSVEETYLVCNEDKTKWSHGYTLEAAREDLIYKIKDRDKSKYSSYTLTTAMSFENALEMYRVITGACAQGTKHFVEQYTVDKNKTYTVQEVLDLTDGAYGSADFKQFFENK